MGDVESYKDPLEYTKIAANTFSRKEENEDRVSMNAYEILESICEQWGMRVMLSDGYFRFYQVNAYEDEATTKYERLYERTSGGFSADTTFTGYSVDVLNTNFPYVEAGGQFQWFAPLKNDNANYNGIGFATDSTYGNLIATEKLGTALARNLTLLNQSGYISLTEAGNLGVGILTPNTGLDIYNGTSAYLWLHTANSGITGTDGYFR